jgi:agmatine deiminase
VGQRNLAAIRGQTDARGRRLEIEIIHEGHYHPDLWDRECKSYVNSYLANGAVIVPGYADEHDAAAVETYRRLYPERVVVQVQIGHIALGGGGIHCITQQQPAVA